MLALAAIALAAGAASPLDSGTVRVGLQETAFPFSYVDAQGHRRGYALEICERAVERLNARREREGGRPPLVFKPVPVTSSTRLALLLAHRIDLECGSTTHTAARARLGVGFSATIFVSGVTALVRRDAARPITRFSELKERLVDSKGFVVTTEGSTSVRHLRELIQDETVDLRYGQTHEDSFAQLVDEDHSLAFVMDEVLLRGRLAAAPAPVRAQFEVLKGTITPTAVEHYALMFRHSDQAFARAFQAALAELFRSGEMERIYERWFTAPIPAMRPHRRGTEAAGPVTLGLPLSEGLRQLFQTPSSAPFGARP